MKRPTKLILLIALFVELGVAFFGMLVVSALLSVNASTGVVLLALAVVLAAQFAVAWAGLNAGHNVRDMED